MKRLCTILLLAMLAVAAKAAQINFTLTIDHADRIVAQAFSGGFIPMPSIVELEDGENAVTATCEQIFRLITTDNEYVISEVTMNGAAVSFTDPHLVDIYLPWDFEGGQMTVTTALAGDTPVDPDPGEEPDPQDPVTEMCQVSFEFANEASHAYVLGASVYNEPIPAFADGFEVEKGTPVELQLDSSLTTDAFTVNGVAPMVIMGTALFTVETNTVIYVKVHENVDYHFTVNIDNAANAEIGYWEVVGTGWFAQRYFRPFPLVDGANELSVNEAVATSVCVRATGDTSSVTSITVNGESLEVEAETNITLAEGMVIDITTATRARDAVCTVICDDYTKVSLTCGGTPVELTSASQQVEFFTDTESTFVFTAKGYGDRIWGVTINGVPVEETFGQYIVSGVADGDVIEVVTAAAEVAVTFSYADELSRSAISRITVNIDGYATELADFDGESFTVPQGAYVSIFINSDMVVEDLTVTGSELLVYPGSYEFSVAGETQVYIKAVEKEKTIINIDVDDAANIRVWYTILSTNWLGMPVMQEVTIDLENGANAVALDPVPETIRITPDEDVTLEIMVDGVEWEADTDIPVTNGMNIEVVTQRGPFNGISSALGEAVTADVYTLQGRLVLRSADAKAIAKLPAGIYIAGGRKIAVK